MDANVRVSHHEDDDAGTERDADQGRDGQPVHERMESFPAEVDCQKGRGQHKNEEDSAKEPALDEEFFQGAVFQLQPFRIVHGFSSDVARRALDILAATNAKVYDLSEFGQQLSR